MGAHWAALWAAWWADSMAAARVEPTEHSRAGRLGEHLAAPTADRWVCLWVGSTAAQWVASTAGW
jgi:hypothetical protein